MPNGQPVAPNGQPAGQGDGFSAPRLSRAGSVAAPPQAPQAPQRTPAGTRAPAGNAPAAESMTQTMPAANGAPATTGTGSTATGAAAGAAGAPAPTAGGRPRPTRSGPRRARLQLRHISPLTVLRFSALLSIALFLVWLIMIGLLYGVLDGAGIIGKINDTVTTINGPGGNPPVSTGLVFSAALVIGAVGAVLFVALSTIGSVIYNLCADVVGGIEVTLAERE